MSEIKQKSSFKRKFDPENNQLIINESEYYSYPITKKPKISYESNHQNHQKQKQTKKLKLFISNENIFTKSIFKIADSLVFLNPFNIMISTYTKQFAHIKMIYFNDMFNQSLNDIDFMNLEFLILGTNFNQPIDKIMFPKLRVLVIRNQQYAHDINYINMPLLTNMTFGINDEYTSKFL